MPSKLMKNPKKLLVFDKAILPVYLILYKFFETLIIFLESKIKYLVCKSNINSYYDRVSACFGCFSEKDRHFNAVSRLCFSYYGNLSKHDTKML